MSFLQSILHALGFSDTPSRPMPPGALEVEITEEILDYEWEPSKLSPNSAGIMWILFQHRTRRWPIIRFRRCHINRRTGQWVFRDSDGFFPSYCRCPVRFLRQMRVDAPRGVHTGFDMQSYYHSEWKFIQDCIRVADAHGRAPGVCHTTWMNTPKDRRAGCRPLYGYR